MKLSWFETYLEEALPAKLHDDALFGACAEKLREIAMLNGGEVVVDDRIPKSECERFAIGRLEQAISRRVRRRLDGIYATRPAEFFYEFAGDAGGFDIRPAVCRQKIDINTADRETLVGLPGIGDALADKIVRRRAIVGRFETLADVRAVAGMTDSYFEQFRFMITTDGPPPADAVAPGTLELAEAPTLGHLVADLRRDWGTSTMKGLLAELAALARDLERDRLPVYALVGDTRASHVKRIADERHRAVGIGKASVKDVETVGLLLDSQYLAFLHEIIGNASKSIDVAMFYIALGDNPRHPNRAVLDRLADARKRGVRVRVILDKDREGDVSLSREINSAAFERLKELGIDVKFDAEDRLLHTKLVVVDRRLVVVGSHNWTAGSYEGYDDVSVFAVCKDLARHYTKWFDSQF